MKGLFDFPGIIDFFTPERLQLILKVVITIVAGLFLFRLLAFLISRLTRKRLSAQASMITRKIIFYAGMIILVMVVFKMLGFSLAALLGTAGVVGIAVGFAAQKSISNLISGLFLISEKPFAISDVIQVGSTTGVVLSIDLLSIKIRTFDNKYVRIPNEQILNSELTNITRFPIRRVDFNIGVAYKENLNRVKDLLLSIAETNPLCLDEPAPLFLIKEFNEYSIDILFGVWGTKNDFLGLKNSMMIEIKETFDREGIEIPFPHRTLYTGAQTSPMPVQIVRKKN